VSLVSQVQSPNQLKITFVGHKDVGQPNHFFLTHLFIKRVEPLYGSQHDFIGMMMSEDTALKAGILREGDSFLGAFVFRERIVDEIDGVQSIAIKRFIVTHYTKDDIGSAMSTFNASPEDRSAHDLFSSIQLQERELAASKKRDNFKALLEGIQNYVRDHFIPVPQLSTIINSKEQELITLFKEHGFEETLTRNSPELPNQIEHVLRLKNWR